MQIGILSDLHRTEDHVIESVLIDVVDSRVCLWEQLTQDECASQVDDVEEADKGNTKTNSDDPADVGQKIYEVHLFLLQEVRHLLSPSLLNFSF